MNKPETMILEYSFIVDNFFKFFKSCSEKFSIVFKYICYILGCWNLIMLFFVESFKVMNDIN